MDWDVVIINPKIMCGQPDNHVFMELIGQVTFQVRSEVWGVEDNISDQLWEIQGPLMVSVEDPVRQAEYP